jgi:hypothetical protein
MNTTRREQEEEKALWKQRIGIQENASHQSLTLRQRLWKRKGNK